MRKKKSTIFIFLLRYFAVILGVSFIIALGISTYLLSKQQYTLNKRLDTLERQKLDDESEDAEKKENKIFKRTVERLEEILRERNAEQTKELFETFIKPRGEGSLIAETSLVFREDGKLRGTLLHNNKRYFRIKGLEVKGAVQIESRLNNTLKVKKAGAEIVDFIRKEREQIDNIIHQEIIMRDVLVSLGNNEAVKDYFKEKKLSTTRIVKDGFVLRMGIVNQNSAVITRLAADPGKGEYRIDGKTVDSADRFEQKITEVLDTYDPLHELRETYEHLQERFFRLVDNEGFKDYIKDRRLSIAEEPKQKELSDFVYTYPVTISNGAELAAFILDAKKGQIAFKDYVQGKRIVLEQLPVSPALTKAAGKEGEHPNFLIIGTHNGLSDTIILLKPGKDTISLLSIPRDTYYNGRKINELFKITGPRDFIPVIEKLTSVKIDHYITVEMNIFPKLVDALGTITVELNNRLLDPTMQYYSDGEKRMLFFPAGRHELDGKAALALARSRKTSSDFSRARRQQIVLQGIRQRVDQLNLTDAGIIYQLLETFITYAKTDMNLIEMLHYYRRYRDVSNLRNKVLSTDNVFYSTYAGLSARGMSKYQAAELDRTQLGAWILLPKLNDWSLIPWYVTRWFSGVEPDIKKELYARFAEKGINTPIYQNGVRMIEAMTGVELRPVFTDN